MKQWFKNTFTVDNIVIVIGIVIMLSIGTYCRLNDKYAYLNEQTTEN